MFAGKLSDPSWAWGVYEPDEVRPWDLGRAGHLYRRAGFGASWSQLQRALSDGPQKTIEGLLWPDGDVGGFNKVQDKYESSTNSAGALRAWWLRRMIETPNPLLEKMTLFWHGYFATNADRVKNAGLMHKQMQLLRGQALGSFEKMLEGIWCDPAMLLWLGAQVNRKARPNETLARTLLGIFTIGEGGFTENDVREAARAFTGWFVLRGRLRYIEHEHDDGAKKVLGQEGRFTGEDVIRILLEQSGTARTVVGRLYRWLISEDGEPETRLIGPLAESFAEDYDILRLVETMLRSNLFFSEAAYRRRVKCPVEYAVGIVKAMEATVPTMPLAQDAARLGQNLYHPPTVKGWKGGRHWIDSAMMIARDNLASALLGGAKRYGERLNPWGIAKKHGCSTAGEIRRFLVDLFLDGNLDDEVYEPVEIADSSDGGGDLKEKTGRLAQMIVTLPEFQLA